MTIPIFKPTAFTIFIAMMVGMNTSHAEVAWLDSIKLDPKSIRVGEEVTIEVRLQKEADPQFRYYCGIELRTGDSNVRTYVIGRAGSKATYERVLRVPHTFVKPGNYSISVEGALVFRGLVTAPPCRGRNLTAALLVAESGQSSASTPPKSNSLVSSAEAPVTIKPPLDQADLLKHSVNDPVFSDLISLIQEKNKGAIPLLLLKAKSGDVFAQTFLGVYYEEDWSDAPDPNAACYWYRRAAEGGVSSARLMVANRALKTPDCFSPRATAMQAYTWVQLALMSKDSDIKAQASALLTEIKASMN